MTYEEFLESKKIVIPLSGFDVDIDDLNPLLFQFQKDIVKWALKKGKSAIFAMTGLGKGFMLLEWANQVVKHTQGKVLVLAPLAVSRQFITEAKKLGVVIKYCQDSSDVIDGINITNYERIEKFNADDFIAVALDESSRIRDYTGKQRNLIVNSFRDTKYKLACTATPSPNDYMELGNHSDFLGVMTGFEMLAMYFTHDSGDISKWRLKRHGEPKFWEWVASWAVMLIKPADLGYEDDRYNLPPLVYHSISVQTALTGTGLFNSIAQTLQEQQRVKRASLPERCRIAADLANSFDESVLIWCNLNDESAELKKLVNGAVEVKGSDTDQHKETSLLEFARGNIKKLVSKPVIAGHGMNFQVCSKIIFVGLSHSFEQYYQAIRRCWRFGQTEQVDVYIISADTEGAILDNIKRKEINFEQMLSGMIANTQEITKSNLKSTMRKDGKYNPQIEMEIPKWLK